MGKNTTITDRLIWLRLKHFGKRGKRAFAEAIGIPLSTYASYEAGRVPPSEVIVRVSQITGCDLEWLMTGKSASDKSPITDPEISAILGRLEKLIADQPKAKQAITALMDLLTLNQSNLQAQPLENTAVTRKVKHRSQNIIPLIGSAAAGLPAYWLSDDDAPIITLEEIADTLDPDEFAEHVKYQLTYPLDSQEVIGEVEIVQLAEPIELYGLLIDGLIIADSQQAAGRLFGVRVDGDSMAPLLTDGDIVIGDSGLAPENGNLVLAELNDRIGALCKFYFRDGSNIRLSSANRKYPPIETTIDGLRWMYKVVGKVRSRTY